MFVSEPSPMFLRLLLGTQLKSPRVSGKRGTELLGFRSQSSSAAGGLRCCNRGVLAVNSRQREGPQKLVVPCPSEPPAHLRFGALFCGPMVARRTPSHNLFIPPASSAVAVLVQFLYRPEIPALPSSLGST